MMKQAVQRRLNSQQSQQISSSLPISQEKLPKRSSQQKQFQGPQHKRRLSKKELDAAETMSSLSMSQASGSPQSSTQANRIFTSQGRESSSSDDQEMEDTSSNNSGGESGNNSGSNTDSNSGSNTDSNGSGTNVAATRQDLGKRGLIIRQGSASISPQGQEAGTVSESSGGGTLPLRKRITFAQPPSESLTEPNVAK